MGVRCEKEREGVEKGGGRGGSVRQREREGGRKRETE